MTVSPACRSSLLPAAQAVARSLIERLEDRRLLSVSLAPAVSTPLSAAPVGDPAAPLIADLDNDGKLDAVVAFPSPSAIAAGFIQFGKGDGTGVFAMSPAVDAGIFTSRPVVGDFNGDDLPDLAVTNAYSGEVKVLTGVGNGTFNTAATFDAGISPESLATGDFNADGLSDLAVGNRADNTVSVYLGNAGTTLTSQTTIATATDPASVAVGTFALAGTSDILVGASGGVNASSGVLQVFRGNGDGTFNAAAITTLGPRGVTAVANLDNDSGPDVIVGVSDRDRADALLNNGNGTFTLTPGSTGASGTKSAVAFDVDGNGTQDLVTAVGGRIDVLPGLGNGQFDQVVAFDAAGGSGPAVADIDGNGRGDVLTITATPQQTAGRTLNVSMGQLVGPDLSIAMLTAPPPSALTGSTGTITVRLTNNGNEKLRAEVPIQIVASTNTTVETDDSLLTQTVRRLNLGIGKSKNVKLKFTYDALPGDFHLIARVDPFGTAGDLNLGDNTVLSTGVVTVGQAFVDLQGQLPATPSGLLSAGDRVRLNLLVTNLGNVKGSGQMSFTAGLSENNTFESTDTALKSVSRNFKINPGQTKTVKLNFKMPSTTAGTYFVLGVIDPGVSFIDSNLDNNVAVGPTQVTVQ